MWALTDTVWLKVWYLHVIVIEEEYVAEKSGYSREPQKRNDFSKNLTISRKNLLLLVPKFGKKLPMNVALYARRLIFCNMQTCHISAFVSPFWGKVRQSTYDETVRQDSLIILLSPTQAAVNN